MNAALFTIAVCVIAISVAVNWRSAPWPWRIWALFYLATELALREALHHRLGHIYPWLLYTQQLGTALLLIPVVNRTARPSPALVAISTVAALILSALFSQAHHWPKSHEETVMELVGTATLALGFITAIAAIARQTAECFILAGFLLLYSALMLAGADYLTVPGLGEAWSVLEITAFVVWAAYYGHRTATLKSCSPPVGQSKL